MTGYFSYPFGLFNYFPTFPHAVMPPVIVIISVNPMCCNVSVANVISGVRVCAIVNGEYKVSLE